MNCLYCKKGFKPKQKVSKYCSRRCGKNAWSKYKRTKEDVMWSAIKYRSRVKGLKHLSREDFNIWVYVTSPRCEYCALPKKYLKYIKAIGKLSNLNISMLHIKSKRFQIDRRDSSSGYIIDNMVFACPVCNKLKSYYWSYDEFRHIAYTLLRPKWWHYVNKKATKSDDKL